MFDNRLERLHGAMAAEGFDVVGIMPGPNFQYLTGLGFGPSDRPMMGFYKADGTTAIAISALEYPRLRDAPLPYPVTYTLYTDADGPEGAFAEALAAVGMAAGARLGVEPYRLRYKEMQMVEQAVPGVQFADADAVCNAVRRCKDAGELDLMRRAIQISQDALDRVLAAVRPGMTERQIAAMLMTEMLNGGGDVAFILVQGGPNAALPHGTLTERPVQAGECLLIDYGAKIGGYPADITRTFAMGRPFDDPKLHEMYALVLASNAAGRAACAPGVPPQEIDRVARKVIADGGYGEYFIHRTGHGLGLEGHEDPFIVEGNAVPLEVGNVFTIEPGAYVPGLGGVRIEDNMVVTPDGAECLTSYPRELRVVGAD
jgi:Xaa-Pro dipeptidase